MADQSIHHHLTPHAQPHVVVDGEHEARETVTEDFYYPDHDGRTESPTFSHAKRESKRLGMRCAITGQREKLELHHALCEYSFANAVRWDVVKGIALGEVKELPVIDPYTWQPTGEMAPVEGYIVYMYVKFWEWRGFDFHTFDPSKPETLVDSLPAMLPLHAHLHRERNHGAHQVTGPIFLLQGFPLVDGFIFSPDILEAQHRAMAVPVTEEKGT